MKISLSLLILFFLPSILFAQKINYSSSLYSALQSARYLKKDVLVIINSENTNAEKQNRLFSYLEIVNKVNTHFISYQANYGDTALKSIIQYYNIQNCPTYIFLHSNMELFYRSLEFDAPRERFLDILKNAVEASQQTTIKKAKEDYLKDTSDITKLKQLIDVLKKRGVTNNAYYIEQYAKKLSPASFDDYQTILYILEAGPIINGIAYRKAFANRVIIDSIFKKEPEPKRAFILNVISNNTMVTAIKTICLADAQNTANFHKNQWQNSQYNGQKIYNEKMLFYYNSVKDTSSYFKLATNHYDKYYMSIRIDSIENLKLQEKTDSTLRFKPGWNAKSFPDGLNEVAWNFYSSGTKNREHLLRAIKWSKRSVKLDPNPNNFDTLAHLYYSLQDFKKAIKAQETAINTAKINGLPTNTFSESLLKMKSKTL
ncbi:hypothetical protein HDC90_000581 [Pedobacter sp. AK013]|uniref:hypothetical protein n=1 Tax=Pedobacter sp. AK013 TaxID=2723071 RepID=UPI001616FD4E|nr:hypothetical protein [Pedobacter sp. AK013]MBB6235975.1 hypothetical protein [Pedobacter sp. AK013]